MPRYTTAIAALLVTLFAVPVPAQNAAESRDAEEVVHELVGTWMGSAIDDEAVGDGEFVLAFNADGTGMIQQPSGESGDIRYTYDPQTQQCVIFFEYSDGSEEGFPVGVIFDGDTATFTPEDGDEVLVARRVIREDSGESQPVEAAPDTVVGTWYVQRMEDEWTPADSEMRLEFREDGTAHFFEDGEEDEEVVDYVVDEGEGTIQIIDRVDGDVEVVLAYHFIDDVLLLVFMDFGADESEMEMELTRSAEGSAEHQRMRARGDRRDGRRSQLQSRNQMRGLQQGLTTYAWSNTDRYPAYLGLLLPGDYVVAGYFLTPWAPVDVPEDIDDWSEDEKIEWVRTNTSYAFVRPGQVADGDPDLVTLFELPLFEGTETIGICFDDNHVERFPYDEADDLIEEQTGSDLMQWMEDMGREQIPVDSEAGDVIEEEGAEGDDTHGHDHNHEEAHDHAPH